MIKIKLCSWQSVTIITGSRLSSSILVFSKTIKQFKENLKNNSDVMFGCDYSYSSVPPVDHVGQ